ncbi:S8 family serine peptidase [Marinigracilibium pacificum]|uniref:S8 family serine peptidase n=1 Tax=Marinigracilibium pacificum TaxID=2729599 RepID=A0A848J493_9BACT|nr:S8 family serine peptidase [Marinigracilibium pacificum]NMM49340.1 S8 family serine peptidase [Marinigracilibium pacificum]
MRKFILFIVLLFGLGQLQAQTRYVIKTRDFVSTEELSVSFPESYSFHSARSIINAKARNKPTIVDEIYFVTKPKGISEKTFLNSLKSDGRIEFAEKDIIHQTYETPNDISIGNQYYLELINAFEAWDISKSNANVVIGIVDSGIDLNHDDLVSKLAINDDEIPNNNIDDDNDGYIDNYQGWDFAGPDTTNLNYAGDPGVGVLKNVPGTNHGNLVSGVAAAATNNNLGIAGVGYNASLLITKHSFDNQAQNDRSVYFTLAGVLYMIEQGADIVNMSFGTTSRSDIWQSVIDYGIENGVIFIAAAGNSGLNSNEYPAAYDGVFAVASSDSEDKVSSFSNYGYYVDIIAPGSRIYTTNYNNSYTYTDGTSFSSPIVAGAAALVKGKYPDLSPKQILDLLRISADPSIYNNVESKYRDRLGYGRLDVFKALTIQTPSLSFDDVKIRNERTGQVASAGDTAVAYGILSNTLWKTSNATKVTISTVSPFVEILNSEIFPGVIDSTTQLNTIDNPFRIKIAANIPNDLEVPFKISFSDGAYEDYQYITLLLNPTYINIQRNLVSSTITGEGRIGFNDALTNAEEGIGFLYNDRNLLFEMGLLMTSGGKLSNNIRGEGVNTDDDFKPVDRIKNIVPGEFSTEEAFGSFDDSKSDNPLNVLVNYRSMVWGEEPDDKYIIVEYEIENQSGSDMNDLYVGLFADWDISQLVGPPDRAGYYSNGNINLGFVHNLKESDSIYVGIQTLVGDFNYWAIDNDSDIPDNPWGVYDGYTDEEKIESMTSGIGKPRAGIQEDGNDVSHTVSIGPLAINAGESTKVAFALIAGDQLSELVESAEIAYSKYNQTLKANKPSVDTLNICYGSNVTIKATGASKYNWYKDFTGGEPVLTNNSQITLSNVKSDTILYVSNATNSFESVRTPAVVNVIANPEIRLSKGSSAICDGDSIVLSVQDGNQYLWSTGETERIITVKDAGVYTVTVTNNQFGCNNIQGQTEITLKAKPTSLFSASTDESSIFDKESILFTDQSTDAVAWFWSFGDGVTSVNQNPEHVYENYGDFNVTLTVTGENGCQDISTRPLIITSVGDDLNEEAIVVYPNPSASGRWKIINLPLEVESLRVINIQGRLMKDISISDRQLEIDGANWTPGLYIVEVQTPEKSHRIKIVKY